MIDFLLIKDFLPYFLRGAFVSIQIAFFSCLIGIALGTLCAFVQSGRNKILRIFVGIYVTLFRGTPMLIQLTFAFHVLPQLGFRIPSFFTAIMAIGLNNGAFISQIIRSGINAVDKGQLEAAEVLGLSKWQKAYYILLPQAITMVIPALCNQFITLVRDSSLASVIGVVELTKVGHQIINKTSDTLTVYTIVAIIYLIITGTLSFLVKRLEIRMGREDAKN